MAHIEPTRGQLQATFEARRRADWPSELDVALADPIYGRIVRLHARRLAEGHDDFAGDRMHHRPEVIAPEPPHPAEPAAPRIERPQRPAKPRRAAPTVLSPQLPLIDRKRAAAGDADD